MIEHSAAPFLVDANSGPADTPIRNLKIAHAQTECPSAFCRIMQRVILMSLSLSSRHLLIAKLSLPPLS